MRLASAFLVALVAASGSKAQQPLSAIEWLKDPQPVTVAQPFVAPLDEPPVTEGVLTPEVTTLPLGTVHSDAVGLLPSATTGLPKTLWQASAIDTITARLSQLGPDPLPAMQALYYTLLLAEADAPADASSQGEFLKARIKALRQFGAIDPGISLLERAGPASPALFDPWLDLALLDGSEDSACKALLANPQVTQSYARRIFCTARAGDWQTAALTYEGAVAIGVLSDAETELLAQFLDPETIEDAAVPSQPSTMTPLVFRLFEAAGTPLPTRALPRAYAVADLRGTAGWKAQIEAAERLARTGALPANHLFGLYTERDPAASGGVWDRVATIQAFDAAISAGHKDAIARTLAPAWEVVQNQHLEVPFATFYASELTGANLNGPPRALAFRIALLSPDYESAAMMADPTQPDEVFLAGLATGQPDSGLADTTVEQAIYQAFASNGAAQDHTPLLNAGELGLAILNAAMQLDEAGRSQTDDITAALATLRAVGLEDTARRAALQLLLLERRS